MSRLSAAGHRHRDIQQASRRGASTVAHSAKQSFAKTLKLYPPDKEAEKIRKKNEQAEAEALKKQWRMYARRSTSANDALQKSLPLGARAYPDDFNGRWRLSYRNESKSASWAAIGADNAAAAAIRQVWQWSVEHGAGDVPPAVAKALAELDCSK